jgi:integrase/recombinase XerD
MLKDEKIIEIVDRITTKHSNINGVYLRNMLEEILYNCDIVSIENALVLRSNTVDKLRIYLASRKIDGLSDRTLKGYYQHLMRFSNSIHKNIEDITTSDIRMYLAWYIKTGVKNSTIATEISTLKPFFKWLQIEKYITDNPMDRINNIKVEKRLRKAITQEELEILRDNCSSLRMRALLEVFCSTGCRLDEIYKLNKSDINWQDMSVNVIGKGNKERPVYLNPKAKIHLKKYLLSRDDDCEALFVTERHPIKRVEHRSIQREFKKLQNLSGVDKSIFPHLMRHYFCTTLLSKKVNLKDVRDLMGHTSSDTTLQYDSTGTENIKCEHKRAFY